MPQLLRRDTVISYGRSTRRADARGRGRKDQGSWVLHAGTSGHGRLTPRTLNLWPLDTASDRDMLDRMGLYPRPARDDDVLTTLDERH